MNAAGLREALRAANIEALVQVEGRMAVLRANVPLDPTSRRRIVALGREHGFTNVALELAPDETLPGD